jgi:hypothetical protein
VGCSILPFGSISSIYRDSKLLSFGDEEDEGEDAVVFKKQPMFRTDRKATISPENQISNILFGSYERGNYQSAQTAEISPVQI